MRFSVNDNNGMIEIHSNTSNVRVYKIPYTTIKDGKAKLPVANRFIVYILLGRQKGKDMVYVGKSVNGLSTRPTSHQDKCESWNYCFVLTQTKEGSFLNDGTIQYLENQLSKQVTSDGYYINTTRQTNIGTANETEIDDCQEFLDIAYKHLRILGLEIESIPSCQEEETPPSAPPLEPTDAPSPQSKELYPLHLTLKFKDGNPKVTKTAHCDYYSGCYCLLPGSSIKSTTSKSCPNSLKVLREKILKEQGPIIKEKIDFKSPTKAAAFVKGCSVNGQTAWVTEDGTPLGKWASRYKS